MTTAGPEVPRRTDDDARRAYAAEPVPESLAAARVGIEHIDHHGRPLRFTGSSYSSWTTHRFACAEPTCPFVLAWRVTS